MFIPKWVLSFIARGKLEPIDLRIRVLKEGLMKGKCNSNQILRKKIDLTWEKRT